MSWQERLSRVNLHYVHLTNAKRKCFKDKTLSFPFFYWISTPPCHFKDLCEKPKAMANNQINNKVKLKYKITSIFGLGAKSLWLDWGTVWYAWFYMTCEI